MFVIIGWVVALGCVFGVYIAHGGNIGVILHALPFEMVTIFGAACGAFLANNQMKVVKAIGARHRPLLQGQQVQQGALHGAAGAALRHPAEGAQGRPDVDREGRRGAAELAAVPEVPQRRQRPPCHRVHHRLPAHDGLGQPERARDREPDGQRDRDPPPGGARRGGGDPAHGRRTAGLRHRRRRAGCRQHHGLGRPAAGGAGRP